MRYITRLVSCLVALLLLAFSSGNPVAAANPITLPAGFIDEVVYGGLLAPRAFAFTPDGRVLVTERGGAGSDSPNLGSIRVFKNGVLLPTRAYTLTICGDVERGLLGITVDPDFLNNGYIYIYYTHQATSGPICDTRTFHNGNDGGPRNRISRLSLSGDVVVAGSERILVDNIASDGGNHNAGDLHFGTDGYLYASTGDGGTDPSLSPNTGTLNGKILRILPTPGDAGGYTTTGNPYDADPNARNCLTVNKNNLSHPCKEIYAKGFRNPFRFTMQPDMVGIPGTGSPFIGDAGQSTWEEVDQIDAAHIGGDYGWPVREGFCLQGVLCSSSFPSGGYDNPVYAYSHQVGDGNVSSVIIGGDFYIGGANYPAQYLNNYFYADYVRGFIGRLVYSSAKGWMSPAQYFATNVGGPVGLQRGPDGNLYYLTYTSFTNHVDGIHRIRYVDPPNAAPIKNTFTTHTPTLTWNRVTSATRYQVEIDNNSNFSAATIYQAGNNLALTLSSPLPNGFYYWRVAACTTATTCGNWSATDTFVIDAS